MTVYLDQWPSNDMFKVWRVHVWQNYNQKNDFDVQLLVGLIPSHKESPNFWHVISQLRTALYWNHIVPDRQGSAAHKIPNYWISPKLRGGKYFDPVLNVKHMHVISIWSNSNWIKSGFSNKLTHVIINFEEKTRWIKSEAACICSTWLPPSHSIIDQNIYPHVLRGT